MEEKYLILGYSILGIVVLSLLFFVTSNFFNNKILPLLEKMLKEPKK